MRKSYWAALKEGFRIRLRREKRPGDLNPQPAWTPDAEPALSGAGGLCERSGMKTLLIPTEDHDAMPAVLEAARLVARQFDSHMEGFAVRPSAGTYVTVEPVSSLAISGAFEGDTAIQARAQFEAFMKSHDVPQADREPAGYSYAWPRAESAEDAYVGSYGRSFDLIVLGRPGREPAKSPHAAARGRAVRKRSAGADRAEDRAADAWPQRAGRLERQHRTGAHQHLRDAAVAPGRAR